VTVLKLTQRRSAGRRSRRELFSGQVEASLASVAKLMRAAYYLAVFLVLLLRLIAYALLLLPAFSKLGWDYFHNPYIRRGLRYGQKSRNFLDIYLPTEAGRRLHGKPDSPMPVVVSVMGGAWVIGHRLWNVQLANRLADAGVIVVAVDYRNFPSATLPEMLDDIDQAMNWIFTHIAEYGGDAENVVLLGQSAGAHLSSMLLLREWSDLEAPAWSVSDLKAFVGISGVYDLVSQSEYMDSIGVYPFLEHFCVSGDLKASSPSHLLPSLGRAVERLPDVHLFHGEADTSVPTTSTVRFAEQLLRAGARRVEVKLKPGISHSHPIVEGPLGNCHDQVELILPALFGAEEALARQMQLPLGLSMPRPVLDLASLLMPF